VKAKVKDLNFKTKVKVLDHIIITCDSPHRMLSEVGR